MKPHVPASGKIPLRRRSRRSSPRYCTHGSCMKQPCVTQGIRYTAAPTGEQVVTHTSGSYFGFCEDHVRMQFRASMRVTESHNGRSRRLNATHHTIETVYTVPVGGRPS